MATNAFISNFKLERINKTVSPWTYHELEEITGAPTVGESLQLEDVTHLQSTAREYIGGLADGDEITAECNRVIASPSVQDYFIANQGQTESFRATCLNRRVSPNTSKVYTFDAVLNRWSEAPSVGTASKINFTMKITGGVTSA